MGLQSILFLAIPLSASISLVYCATRYELKERILRSAAAMFAKTVAGLLGLYAVLWFISS